MGVTPLRRAAVVSLVSLLAGCGGGFSLGIGGYYEDDEEWPSVSLVATDDGVPAGGALRFVAAAAHHSGIHRVEFMRYDQNVAHVVGVDYTEPYEMVIAAPDDGRDSLHVVARAVANEGQIADSNGVSVAVLP